MKRFHHSWIIALCGVFVLMCTNGFSANIFASYLPFIRDLGYSGTQASALVTTRCVASFLGMTILPYVYRRINLRWGLTIACLLIAVAFIIYSVAHTYAGFVTAATAMGLAHGLGGMIPISILMNNWFYRRRATAISICTLGMGVGAIVLPPIIVRVAQSVSLSVAFRLISYLSVIIAVFSYLIIRDTPAESKLSPYGAGELQEKSDQPAASPEGHDIPRVTRYIMLFALLLLGGVAVSASGHYTTLFTSVGYSKEAAALSLTVLGISLVVSKLTFGPLVDRWGGEKASLLFLIILTLGTVFCCLSPIHPAFMYAGTLFMGYGYSPATVGISIYATDFSTARNFSSLLKDFQRAYIVGGIVFTAIPGRLFDVFGSYVISYWMFAAMVVIFTVVLLLVYHSAEVKKA